MFLPLSFHVKDGKDTLGLIVYWKFCVACCLFEGQLATGGDIGRVHRSVPIDTDPEEFVYILKDCDTPVIFCRQHEDTDALVGTAFVLGL